MSSNNSIHPSLITPPHLRAIQDELIGREPIFHRAGLGATREAFESMMDEAFWEVGASGQRYSRSYVLDILEERHSKPADDDWETRGFYCQVIAPDNYLLTYTLLQGPRVTRRATIWRRTAQGWKIVYHQGTIAEPE
ncbi:MAG: DUF4440 domain-containing protein [Gammaproteobacteria bacterium]|jgi:hypothetical protein